MSVPPSRMILGTRVDATTYADACDRIQAWARARASCYVIAANVHVVMTAYWNRTFQRTVNGAALITPDGMPLVWGLRLMGITSQPRVYGPELMLAWCDRAAKSGIPIYLYGGTVRTLERLQIRLERRFPGLQIVGTYSPPFGPVPSDQEAADVERIHAAGAPVVFVALGCPKQEQWMARQQGRLSAVMIGVGAAFRFHSGEVAQAPPWMMSRGLEWLYRFIREPARLWRRYVFCNPVFVVLFGTQLLRRWLEKQR